MNKAQLNIIKMTLVSQHGVDISGLNEANVLKLAKTYGIEIAPTTAPTKPTAPTAPTKLRTYNHDNISNSSNHIYTNL